MIPTLAGYIFYKSMEGRAESEMDRTYGEKSLGKQKSFNKEAMMTEILKEIPAAVPCVFSDQIGRGRTTNTMVIACLVKEIQITTELR